MEIPSKIIFVDNETKKVFEKLKQSKGEHREIYKWLVKAFAAIEQNAFCGIQIPKRLIPSEYIKKYKIHSLWKYNLPNSWRLLYSIESDEEITISIILGWLDHKEYNRRFKY